MEYLLYTHIIAIIFMLNVLLQKINNIIQHQKSQQAFIEGKYGYELIFISRINRDGSGVTICENMDYLSKTKFRMSSLSLSNKTLIACEMDSFVVKLKN